LLTVYGDESHPLAFSHSGEFQYANRGLLEFVESLKLQVEFLYDLLEATQDDKIKPKNQPNVYIDEALFGHTNNPEFVKLINNESMEAFRNRIIVVNVPYNLEHSEEEKIYGKMFSGDRVPKHIAPFTVHLAAMWAILSRLEHPQKHQMTLMQKLKLYDGQVVDNFTKEDIRELRGEASREGFMGVSPRFIQDSLTNLMSQSHYPDNCVNPAHLFLELEDILSTHASIENEKMREAYGALIDVVKEEYTEIAKDELRRALCADEAQMDALFKKYVDNVHAFQLKAKVKDQHTGETYEPDEKFMRGIEEHMDIDPDAAKEHRIVLMAHMNQAFAERREFDYKQDAKLYRALQLELFESVRHKVNLAEFSALVKSKEGQEQVDLVKGRLIGNMGYCEECARDLLIYASKKIQD